MKTAGKARLEMLQASIDEDDESHFRFLVDWISVKYLTIDSGLFTSDDMAFAPVLLPLLPQFPPGDWNVGRICKDHTTGKPAFSEFERELLPTVQKTWHNHFFDILDFQMDHKLRTNVYRARHPQFRSTVIAKFAVFPWEVQYLEDETNAYQWIDGTGIGVQFLGHLTEEGRVIGFLLEDLSEAYHPGPQHLVLCQQVVTRLHQLGIRHGDLNKNNILISDGRAILIDFDVAHKCEDRQPLESELEGLLANLEDETGRGGLLVRKTAPDVQSAESVS